MTAMVSRRSHSLESNRQRSTRHSAPRAQHRILFRDRPQHVTSKPGLDEQYLVLQRLSFWLVFVEQAGALWV